jgi:tRNA G18 (ribose-2'-O)-methylase SpoU
VTVILDNLRSAFNVGSVFRTADGALVEKVVTCGYTAHPPHAKLEKTALGTLASVPWEHRPSAADAARDMRGRGVPVVALETTSRSCPLWEFHFPLPVCLLLGNEALGVSPEALALADEIVEIPCFGYKNSINVAVAFGIAAAEIMRQHWNVYRGRERAQGQDGPAPAAG